MKHLLSINFVLAAVLVSAGHAGTAVLEIDRHSTELEVNCDLLSNGMLSVRSEDNGFVEKDTDGDGFFFKATGYGSTVAVIFHASDEEFKFGISDIHFSDLGFEATDKVRRDDGSKYAVDVNVEC